MRRMISQKLIEWIKSIKNHLVQNGNKTEVGGDLEVDGDVQVNSGLAVNGTTDLDILQLENLSKIQDKDGHPIGKDLEDAVSGNNEMTITFTEDDWDEDEQAYVKHLEFNNTYIYIVFDGTPVHEESNFIIYNPYLKGLINTLHVNSFYGLLYETQERFVALEYTALNNYFSCFNSNFTPISGEL